MIIIVIILCITMFVIGFFMINIGIEYNKFWEELVGCIVVISSIIILAAIFVNSYVEDSESKPQAIDVYRGKTTLQITYQDSVPVDTVVVYKNKQL